MESKEFESRIDLGALRDSAAAVESEVGTVIVGQHEMLRLLLTALLADGHVLIEGVPGTAKTLTAKLLARCLDIPFSRIQFTPDLMPSDVLGTPVYNQKKSEFEFRSGPIFSNIILIDEINRAPAKTQSALFEVMEERQVTVDGSTYVMKEPYLVLATQNPVEHEGTYRLPEAQLDRFLFKILIHYPAQEEEVNILQKHQDSTIAEALQRVRPVLQAQQLLTFRRLVRSVLTDTALMTYMVNIIRQTRSHPALFLGASPRAAVALLNSSKAFAALQGRDFVTPDDVKTLALPVLRHRVILTPEKEMEGSSPDQVLRQIVDSVEVPR
jgi:MoxR-like ATPase